MKTLNVKHEAALRQYLVDIRVLPNESAKTHRFASLLSELFPRSKASTEFAAGVEKLIRIDTPRGKRPRFIDAYHGNAVIEFEKSLKATLDEAMRQLREYCSGTWKKGVIHKLCVASDGLVWKTFRASLIDVSKASSPENIRLEALRTLVLSERTLGDFWMWLTSFIFRGERLEPSSKQFQLDFGSDSAAFSDSMARLAKAWEAIASDPESVLAFDTWKKYLTVTYGQLGAKPSLVPLFLKHTYLASIAKLLIWASLSKGKNTESLADTIKSIFGGDFFRSNNLANLVEDDFFQWIRRPRAHNALLPGWERALDQILNYDLATLSQDILKGVYQDLVDPEDRHDLGEYYTPDWLADRTVEHILPKNGFHSVLDPTCGSGTFLRATISHLLVANQSATTKIKLKGILENVVGIDIHPLAVIIAKITYLLAIGSLIKAATRPVQIPVYLADSLFLPAEVKQPKLGELPSYKIKFGSSCEVSIPEKFVHSPELFDQAISAATTVALDHAKEGTESPKTLKSYVFATMPEIKERPDCEQIIQALWSFADQLSTLIKKKENSIWGFIVRNSYRPAMLKGRFQFIVGNPPWLSYRYISDPEYQAEVKKRALQDYSIAPSQRKLFTQMEIATIFLIHTLTTFGDSTAKLAFVLPKSIASADQHHNLRIRAYKAPMVAEEYWDLRAVKPIFNVPCSVLFAKKTEHYPHPTSKYELPTLIWSGQLPNRDLSWSDADSHLKIKRDTSHVIYLGKRTAWSTEEGRTSPNDPSPYSKHFHQGATILPRNFYFIRIKDFNREESIHLDKTYWAETDPEQAEEAKPPYVGIVEWTPCLTHLVKLG